MQELFVELLQVSIGALESLSKEPSVFEWNCLFVESQHQALVGITACGIEKLPESQKPPKDLLLAWVGMTLQIEQQNAITTNTCGNIYKRIEKDGFFTCILKGQSNHRYYPYNLRNRRSCGDVDVWISPKEYNRHPSKKVLEYVQNNYRRNGLCWLHTSHIDGSGVPVEVHLRASFMSNPYYNKRFQILFNSVEGCRIMNAVDGVEMAVMKIDDDVLFQMNHIYRHLIDEGVGMRQVIDYYMLLKTWNLQHQRSKEEVMGDVAWLGMKRFAGALMYVLKEALGMEETLLLCPAVEYDGRFLLREIMLSGNFGHGDNRMGSIKTNGNYLMSRVRQAFCRFKRNLRFLTSYPGEVIWEPIVRLEHFMWKKLRLWNY